jgi:hypothetical protein
LSIGEVGSEICILHRLETRCRGDVALPGLVSSQHRNTNLRSFPEEFRGNGEFEFSDGL